MKKIFLTIISLAISCLAAVCQERIILLNEGNWQSDNGKISYFENGKIVSNQWFRDKNGMKLGDTPNDIIQVNDNLIAIAINWSNIVQFIRPDGTAVAATEDVPNNRKLATDGRYVYVSSYGHECGNPRGKYWEFEKGFVAKIDINNFKVVDAVEVGYEPEGIAYYKGKLFVANSGGYAFQENHEYETTVSIIDAETMTFERNVDTEQINLFGKMSQIGQYLCINSPGNYYEAQATAIIFDCEKAMSGSDECFVKLDYASTYNCATLDGKFLAIGSRYSYITNENEYNYITIDPAETMASMNDAGVSMEMPGDVLNDLKKMVMPYGIYVNPYTGYIYATDAGSHAEAGQMYQWSPEGKLLGKHKVYINPAHFLALPPDGMSTGVNAAITESIADIYYDMQGRRVQNPQHNGLYIKNNKKVIYK